MRDQKGFTLMEMLIVVAIIAILITISVSTLSESLERSREARDLSTIKSAFSELSACLIMDTPESELPSYIKVTKSGGKITSYYTYVESTQKIAGWQTGSAAKRNKNTGVEFIFVHGAYVPSPSSFTEYKPYKLEAFVTEKELTDEAAKRGYTGPYQYYASTVTKTKGSVPIYKSTKSK